MARATPQTMRGRLFVYSFWQDKVIALHGHRNSIGLRLRLW